MSMEINKIETREREPAIDHLLLFQVRHGQSEYKEQLEQRKDNKVPAEDLTEQGRAEIRKSAEQIASHIMPEQDIILFIRSPRVRTRNTQDELKQRLRELLPSVEIYEDTNQDKRIRHERISNTATLNQESGKVISPESEDYPENFSENIDKLKQILGEDSTSEEWTKYLWTDAGAEFAGFEKSSNIKKRSMEQLAFWKKAAQVLQSRIAKSIHKRLVVIQAEHSETMNTILEKASEGKYSNQHGNGTQNGEVIKIQIPIEGDELTVDSLNRKDVTDKKLNFDAQKKELHI